MKKRVVLIAVFVLAAVLFACAFIPASTDRNVSKAAADNTVNPRFLNMLNHNFVYNSDFENADAVTDNSLLALLDKKDSEYCDYIPEAAVKGFVKDMYGIDILDISEDASVHKDGLVYVSPRGFTSYSHTVTDIAENEDGSFTVISSVTVSPHDDSEFITEAETLFVKNENSAFGYNIVYSNLKGVASGI